MAVQTLAVNSNNDLYLDNSGNIAIAYDLDAVTQGCEQVTRTKLGEIPYDTLLGMPFFEAVWVGVPNIRRYEAALSTAILSVPDVLALDDLTVTQEGEVLSYTAVITTEYGEGEITSG